jgi:hypothetical protein
VWGLSSALRRLSRSLTSLSHKSRQGDARRCRWLLRLVKLITHHFNPLLRVPGIKRSCDHAPIAPLKPFHAVTHQSHSHAGTHTRRCCGVCADGHQLKSCILGLRRSTTRGELKKTQTRIGTAALLHCWASSRKRRRGLGLLHCCTAGRASEFTAEPCISS